MGHGINAQDNLFSVREPTWHGLGTILDDYPTRAEAQRIALPWEPYTAEIFVRLFQGEGIDPIYEKVKDYKAVARDDTDHVLGVVKNGYEVVSNNEIWDIAEALQGSGTDVRFETAGSIDNGRKVWVLLRLNEPIFEAPNDPNAGVVPYYVLQNTHDGTGAFRGQATMTRVVCQNTALAADMDAQARGTEFKFRHSKNVKDRIDEAREALSGWRDSLEAWRETANHLLGLKIDSVNRERYIERFIPEPAPHTATKRVLGNVETARQTLRNILNGETLEGIDNTAYGLVQGSIEYAQHYSRAHNEETRFRRSFLDPSKITRDAVTLAERASMEVV